MVRQQHYPLYYQVIQYSTSIFESAGLSESISQYATLATGAVNSSMTFVSALMMDRLGRRTLHLVGLGGLFIFSYILSLGLIYQVSGMNSLPDKCPPIIFAYPDNSHPIILAYPDNSPPSQFPSNHFTIPRQVPSQAILLPSFYHTPTIPLPPF